MIYAIVDMMGRTTVHAPHSEAWKGRMRLVGAQWLADKQAWRVPNTTPATRVFEWIKEDLDPEFTYSRNLGLAARGLRQQALELEALALAAKSVQKAS